jgi:hypothetical protein
LTTNSFSILAEQADGIVEVDGDPGSHPTALLASDEVPSSTRGSASGYNLRGLTTPKNGPWFSVATTIAAVSPPKASAASNKSNPSRPPPTHVPPHPASFEAPIPPCL